MMAQDLKVGMPIETGNSGWMDSQVTAIKVITERTGRVTILVTHWYGTLSLRPTQVVNAG